MTNQTERWEAKLNDLIASQDQTHSLSDGIVNARLTGVDGGGVATLVSNMKDTCDLPYKGFAPVFQHPEYERYEWLQFITRQLVLDNAQDAETGNLLFQTSSTVYGLVDTVKQITDYTFASDQEPGNWNSCWKVDSTFRYDPKAPNTSNNKIFFGDTYEFAKSQAYAWTAILDEPSPTAGKVPKSDAEKKMYLDNAGHLVNMKHLLGSGKGTSRAYFSDYLVKEVDKAKKLYKIKARFDVSLTWTSVEAGTNKRNSQPTVNLLKATTDSSMLDCHKAALAHKITTNEFQPWKDFSFLL